MLQFCCLCWSCFLVVLLRLITCVSSSFCCDSFVFGLVIDIIWSVCLLVGLFSFAHVFLCIVWCVFFYLLFSCCCHRRNYHRPGPCDHSYAFFLCHNTSQHHAALLSLLFCLFAPVPTASVITHSQLSKTVNFPFIHDIFSHIHTLMCPYIPLSCALSRLYSRNHPHPHVSMHLHPSAPIHISVIQNLYCLYFTSCCY